MALGLDEVRRFARQLALPDIGVAGQERIAAAEVVLVGEGAIVDTAELYLRAAGVGRLRRAPERRGGAGV
jgi:molybdopterin/thiamine biosynthesis adenylyltransferase